MVEEKMKQITLSVIMPVYNGEQYLNYSIQSVLNQTYKDYELILVDDGSTDHSLEICEKYQSKDKRSRGTKTNMVYMKVHVCGKIRTKNF